MDFGRKFKVKSTENMLISYQKTKGKCVNKQRAAKCMVRLKVLLQL